VDRKHPERTDFGALALTSAFHLSSKDKRFGGLSGLSIGIDGRLYAISDNGYWLSAKMVRNKNDALINPEPAYLLELSWDVFLASK